MPSSALNVLPKNIQRLMAYKYKLDPRRFLYFDSHDHGNTVLIAGCARSGTTWLQEIVNYRNDYRSMFEPFHSGKIPSINHFEFRQYLRPENRDASYLEPAKAILSGKVRNFYVDNFNKRFFSTKRLIKDVRINLFLKWIKVNFSKIPIIYIARHPCAVCVSRRERGFDKHLNVFLKQKNLMHDYLEPFRDRLENVHSMFEAYVLMWCVENYVPLQQFQAGEIHIVFYENLCINPFEEIRRIFDFIDMRCDVNDSDLLKVIKRPSKLTRTDSSILKNESLINGWQRQLTSQEIDLAIDILKEFSLDRMYTSDIMPAVNDGQLLLRK